MYDVLEVCRHVINYSNAKKYSISNLKLQKLLYFIQAYFLIASPNKKPCFRQRIEAWDFGPVVPEAYIEYKRYGSVSILPIRYYHLDAWGNKYKSMPIEYKDNEISEADKKLIDKVIEHFSMYSATDLVAITHNQKPWQQAYERGGNREITLEEMRAYFE